MRTYLDFEKPIAELESKVAELKALAAEQHSVSIEEELAKLEDKAQAALRGHLFQAHAVAEDAGRPPSRAPASASTIVDGADRGLHAARRRPLLRRGPGDHRRHRPLSRPLGDGDRPREGLRHRRPHPAQFRHGEARRLPQGRAADGDGRPLRPAGDHASSTPPAPIPASAPRSAARPRPSPAPPIAA